MLEESLVIKCPCDISIVLGEVMSCAGICLDAVCTLVVVERGEQLLKMWMNEL